MGLLNVFAMLFCWATFFLSTFCCDERRSIYKRLLFCFTYHRLIVESRKNSLAEVEKNQSWTRVNMLFRMQQVFRGKVPNSFQILLLFNLAKGRHVFFSLFPLPNFQTQRTFFSSLMCKTPLSVFSEWITTTPFSLVFDTVQKFFFLYIKNRLERRFLDTIRIFSKVRPDS